MFHFFAEQEQISGTQIVITGADYNHIKNVIRLKKGDNVLVSARNTPADENDAVPDSYLCAVERYEDNAAVLSILRKNMPDTELPCRVTLYQGLPKSDKMELIIQKAVELGVHDIVPVEMKRCVVRLDDKKADSKLRRWNAISESAAKQSKRSVIPQVREVISYRQAVDEASGYDTAIAPYENSADMQATRELFGSIGQGSRVAVFIGPEGGFDDEEILLAENRGIKTITLGKRILRTETASMAVLAMLAYALED